MKGEIGAIVLACVAASACEVAQPQATAGNGVCDLPALSAPLPDALEETSGVAASRVHPGVYWTHNDSGGDSVLFAIDSVGTVLARVRVRNATNRDWEDLAIGPCEPGGDDCLFIADIGDNNERHGNVAAYRVPEPDPAIDTVTRPAEIFRFTYPDGPRDAEALFVTDAGIHVVNKGRSDAIELFRLRPPYRTGVRASLERVQRLAPPPTSHSAQVTAAAARADGQRIVIRSYAGLRFYQPDGDTLALFGRPSDVLAPDQIKGEGIDFTPDGRYVVTGEAQGRRPPQIALVQCDPLRPPTDTAAAPDTPASPPAAPPEPAVDSAGS